MPTYTNTSPVVLTVDGQLVAVGAQCTTKSTNKHVRRCHLTPVPKPDDQVDSSTTESSEETR